MAGVGFTNKNDLAKWDSKDMVKARDCKWMIDQKVKNYPDSYFERRKEILWWHKKLCECLPSPELYDFDLAIKGVSAIFNFERFERLVRHARYDITMKLIAYEVQKAGMIEEYANKQQETMKVHSTIEDYRIKQLTQVYPIGSPDDKRQKEEKISGYTPCKEVLLKIPPMELIEYCGFRLIKFDKWHGYFSAMVVDNNKNIEIFYDENAQKLELQAEYRFDDMVDKYLQVQRNKNPYGDRAYEDIDISNVKKAMGYGGKDNPLNRPEIF